MASCEKLSVLRPSRRALLGGAVLGAAAARPAPLRAQPAFPSKPLAVQLASSSGGAFDQSLRAIAPEWEKRLGQPIRPVFAPGPGNVLAATRVVTSPPDGHTLAMVGVATNAVAIHFLRPPNYGQGSLSYIGTTYAGPLAIFVGKNSPIRTIEELAEESRKRRVTAGISGARELYHVGGLMFNRAVGANIQMVPYNGGAPSRLAAVSGEADCVVSGLFDASTHYELLRCLCVMGPENPVPQLMPGRTMREAFGDKGLDIWHPVGLAVSSQVESASPAAFRKLAETYRDAYEASREQLERSGFPKESLLLWDPARIKSWERDFVASIRDIQI
jgi:tripartite-type tricarboxylate transporter receptor subunit TctC